MNKRTFTKYIIHSQLTIIFILNMRTKMLDLCYVFTDNRPNFPAPAKKHKERQRENMQLSRYTEASKNEWYFDRLDSSQLII